MSRTRGSVRMGPISLFTLVILLCLAVLSVLTITTAQAASIAADKQARFTNDTYQNEIAAQEVVAAIDAELAVVRAQGGNGAAALIALEPTLPPNAFIEGDTVQAQFLATSGRTLTITLTIDANAQFHITQWQATTAWNIDTRNETLWSGHAK